MVASIVRLDAALLRSALGALALREGQALAGRVAERHGAHGILVLAGRPLVAELPPDVAAGDRLRLLVSSVDQDRVVLRVDPQPPVLAAPTALPPALRLPLPGRGELGVRVTDREARGGGTSAERHAVGLRLDVPALGALDLRVELVPGAVTVAVAAAPGAPFEVVDAASGELQDAVTSATGRPTSVAVAIRRDPVDVRA
jgi:hypothetical protein